MSISYGNRAEGCKGEILTFCGYNIFLPKHKSKKVHVIYTYLPITIYMR
jgi:hypothetical protein